MYITNIPFTTKPGCKTDIDNQQVWHYAFGGKKNTQTRLTASWGLLRPAGFESGFGFEAVGFGFRGHIGDPFHQGGLSGVI